MMAFIGLGRRAPNIYCELKQYARRGLPDTTCDRSLQRIGTHMIRTIELQLGDVIVNDQLEVYPENQNFKTIDGRAPFHSTRL